MLYHWPKFPCPFLPTHPSQVVLQLSLPHTTLLGRLWHILRGEELAGGARGWASGASMNKSVHPGTLLVSPTSPEVKRATSAACPTVVVAWTWCEKKVRWWYTEVFPATLPLFTVFLGGCQLSRRVGLLQPKRGRANSVEDTALRAPWLWPCNVKESSH